MTKDGDKICNYLTMIGHMCSDINQGALSATLPFLVKFYGYSYLEVTMFVFAANIASSVIQPLFGTISDKHPSPWFMPLGITCASIGMFGIGFFDQYWLIFASAMLNGVGIAMFHPEGGRCSNLAAGSRKSNGMSIFAVGGNVGFFVGPLLAAASISTFGMHGTAVFLIPALTCSAILLYFNKRFLSLGNVSKATTNESKDREYWKNFWIVVCALALRSVAQYGLLSFIPLFFVHVLGQSEAVGSLALCVFSAAGAVATFLSGKTTERYGTLKISAICFILTAFLFLVFALNRNLIFAYLLVVMFAITVDLFYPSLVAFGMDYVPQHLGTASGISYGLVVCAGGIAEPLLGSIGDMVGLPYVFGILTAICVLGTIVVIIIKKKHPLI